ncbi:MAG: MFS transporter [Candidatus Binatia bacterium]
MTPPPPANAPPTSASRNDAPEWYPSYVLTVLVVVYVLNFLDRQILSILNEHIRADLGLTDAEMGFLFGTAFAVFYAIFGIPLGRLADVWVRRSLIAVGLAFWSGMTAVSGLAQNFTQLAAARIGVGIGEASASPAAYSLLSNWFPPRRRATVLAIYSSGIYLGAGCGLMIGGQIVDRWDAAFAPGTAPYGLRGWQVAFFAVGLPGLGLAAWVRTLREPLRGGVRLDVGGAAARTAFGEFFHELGAVLPPLTLWTLAHESGARDVAVNLAAATVLAAVAWVLTLWSGDAAQWIALAMGSYAAFSWMQSLRVRNPEAADVIFGTATLRWAALGFGFLSFTGYAVGYWAAPYFMRVHGVPASEVGFAVGAVAAVAGWLGVSLGGALADAWRARSLRGRLYTGMMTAVFTPPLLAAMLAAPGTGLAFVLNAPLTFVSSAWIGAGIATVHDLVPARLRGTAGAAYLLVVTFIGLALGPYAVGKLSAYFGSLGSALMAGALVGDSLGLICLMAAARTLSGDQKKADLAAGALDPAR